MIRIDYSYGEQVGEAIYLNDVTHDIKYRCAMFRCKCGKTFISRICKVKRLEIIGCGCSRGKSQNSRNHTIHGERKHPLYSVWCAMKARCYNKNRLQYKDYGGRGVVVCKSWINDFEAFFKWAISNGWEKGLQLDKDIKGNGLLYSPETCCFVTPKTNSNKRKNNKIVLYNGQSKTLSEWSNFYNINYHTLCTRFNKGWTIEESLFGRGKCN